MTFKTLVFDEEAVNIFSYASVDVDWFDEFGLSNSNLSVKKIVVGESLYFLSKKSSSESRKLIIKMEENGLFTGLIEKDKSNTFDRIITFALSKFGKAISPKHNWGSYKDGNVYSFFATLKHSADRKRVLVDSFPCGTDDLYVFDLQNDDKKFKKYESDEDVFIEAVDGYDIALERKNDRIEDEQSTVNFGIELTETLAHNFITNYSLARWYDSELTAEQIKFVDKSYDEPVRLKGAAGTGKTLALAVKFLKDAYSFEDKKQHKRLLFLTHSHSSSENILNIIKSMDEECLYGEFKFVDLKISSLYDLAQELLNFDLSNLKPLSTDGMEGRELQYMIVEDLIKSKVRDIYFCKSKLDKSSDEFKNNFLDDSKRNYFILEVLNEFACVLDAENINMGTVAAERYLSGNREVWQMNLALETDRKIVLELHNEYKEKLIKLDALSMDQMIADLGSYFRSHTWNRLLADKGYDAIFVDELHYFTKPERMLLHEFYRGKSSDKVPMFMAYDMKQSNNDSFLYQMRDESAATLFKSTKVGSTDLVELTKVFRYTPEIASFLNDLDASFPALDLVAEWGGLNLNTDKDSGERPKLTIYSGDMALVDDVFKKANNIAIRDKKKTVAILCPNRDIFSKYLELGRIRRYYEAITSRDDSYSPAKLKGKCIFSMPEYVAGHQFNTVFLIHVDKNELDEENPYSGAYRRFVSQVYLASSRAQECLFLSTSENRRGKSQVVDCAIDNGSLEVERFIKK